MTKYWPILVVVAANTFYNIVAKQTPQEVNPFLSLIVTYGVAMLMCVVLFLTGKHGPIAAEVGKINWTAVAFGVIIIGLEFGQINVYRMGWNVNTAPLIANIALAVILLLVGKLLFGEDLTVRKMLGVLVCAAGLILVTGK